MDLIITCLFGLESLVKDDLLEAGYDRTMLKLYDGMCILSVDNTTWPIDVARANIWVRTGERVLVRLDLFEARDFDALFDHMRAFAWEEIIPKDYAFHIDAYSRKSDLFGTSACQSIAKKAIVGRLQSARGLDALSHIEEDPLKGLLRITLGIVGNQVSVMLDTSGDGLHKRGYRPLSHQAPLRETLAGALVRLSRFLPDGPEALVDLFCGSGTIVIEGALWALGIAPGTNRSFAAENWPLVGRSPFDEEKAKAKESARPIEGLRFFGSDIDLRSVENAKQNALRANVSPVIDFRVKDALVQTPSSLAEWTGFDRQLIVCNPPFGERMMDPDQAKKIYRGIISQCLDSSGYCKKGLRLSVLSPDQFFEAYAPRPADMRRKLYNGNIKCQLYHYFKLDKS